MTDMSIPSAPPPYTDAELRDALAAAIREQDRIRPFSVEAILRRNLESAGIKIEPARVSHVPPRKPAQPPAPILNRIPIKVTRPDFLTVLKPVEAILFEVGVRELPGPRRRREEAMRNLLAQYFDFQVRRQRSNVFASCPPPTDIATAMLARADAGQGPFALHEEAGITDKIEPTGWTAA
jgi:hypothetical protein